MTSIQYSKIAKTYLYKLCLEIPTRRVGTKGNRTTTDFFASIVSSFGLETELPSFDCIDWIQEGAHLLVEGIYFEALVNPYSLGCHVNAPFIVVTTVQELASAEVSDKIILLRGDIAKQQLMPKNFPFYNPDEHKRIIQMLETKKPQALSQRRHEIQNWRALCIHFPSSKTAILIFHRFAIASSNLNARPKDHIEMLRLILRH